MTTLSQDRKCELIGATPLFDAVEAEGKHVSVTERLGDALANVAHHGDGHKWIYDRPFEAKNILRVEVDQGGKAPPVKVQVTNDSTEPFVFDRRNGKKAL